MTETGAGSDGGREQIEGLRSQIIGAASKRMEGVPERYVQLAAEKSSQATILDTATGRELTVGLCDLNGAIAALKVFG